MNHFPFCLYLSLSFIMKRHHFCFLWEEEFSSLDYNGPYSWLHWCKNSLKVIKHTSSISWMLVTSKVGISEMCSVFVRLPDKWPLCLNYSMLVKPNKLCLIYRHFVFSYLNISVFTRFTSKISERFARLLAWSL